jgi:hypothetical protein
MKKTRLLTLITLSLALLNGCRHSRDSDKILEEPPIISGTVVSESPEILSLFGINGIKQYYGFTVIGDDKEVYTFGARANHRALNVLVNKNDRVEVQLTDYRSGFQPDAILINSSDIKKVNDKENPHYRPRYRERNLVE